MALSVEIPGDPPQLLSSSSPFRGVFDFYHLTVPRQAGNDRGVKPKHKAAPVGSPEQI